MLATDAGSGKAVFVILSNRRLWEERVRFSKQFDVPEMVDPFDEYLFECVV